MDYNRVIKDLNGMNAVLGLLTNWKKNFIVEEKEVMRIVLLLCMSSACIWKENGIN